MASEVSTLPFDLVQLIAGALESTDLCSLRLVCKKLNEKTLHYFGRTCLASLRTDLSRQNLQELKEFSENLQLSFHVQTLLIKTGPRGLGRGFSWHRHPSGYLVDPLPGFQVLRGILVNSLVNCRSFHIPSLTRQEDSNNIGSITPTDAIGILLAVIAETSLSVKSFSLGYRIQGTGEIDGRRLHMPRYQTPEFRTAWAHLRELFLEQPMTSDTSDRALELVVRAPNLRKLSLRLRYDRPCSFLDRLVSADTLHGLQDLELSAASVTAEMISRLLLRSLNSLRALSLWHVYMGDGDTWASVFRAWKTTLPFLERISVTWLREHRGQRVYRVLFPRLSCIPVVPGLAGRQIEVHYRSLWGEWMVAGASYQGPGMDVALETLASSVVCMKRENPLVPYFFA